MKLHRTVTHNPANIILVPLVNVLVLVLAFATLSGTFVSQPGISITLPFTSFVLGPQRNPQIVHITAGAIPMIYFRERKVSAQELSDMLANASPKERALIIRADGAAPHEMVTQVMNIGLERGFSVAIAGSVASSPALQR